MKTILTTLAAAILALTISGAAQAGHGSGHSQTQHNKQTNTNRRRSDDHRYKDRSRYCQLSFCEPTDCEADDSCSTDCDSCDSCSTDYETADCQPSFRQSSPRSPYRQDRRGDKFRGKSRKTHK
jgi:Ni/Co efflux regulator RcnB